jgi:hypothetical protein
VLTASTGRRIEMTDFVNVPIVRGFREIASLYNAIKNLEGMICGGYVRYCGSPVYKPVPASDVDIYCKDDAVFAGIFYYLKDSNQLEVRHENEISVTFKHPESGPFFYCPPIQLIKPIKEGRVVANGSVEDIIGNFDFSVIRCAIITPNSILADKDFMEDEKKKILRLKNIHCPISSMLRCMKYSRKGYWMRPIESLKLFSDWEGRTVEYRLKIAEYLAKTTQKGGLTQEEVNELEALMRID